MMKVVKVTATYEGKYFCEHLENYLPKFEVFDNSTRYTMCYKSQTFSGEYDSPEEELKEMGYIPDKYYLFPISAHIHGDVILRRGKPGSDWDDALYGYVVVPKDELDEEEVKSYIDYAIEDWNNHIGYVYLEVKVFDNNNKEPSLDETYCLDDSLSSEEDVKLLLKNLVQEGELDIDLENDYIDIKIKF
jgi:hypothetical protein